MRDLENGDKLYVPRNYNTATVYAAAVIEHVYFKRYKKLIDVIFTDHYVEDYRGISVGFDTGDADTFFSPTTLTANSVQPVKVLPRNGVFGPIWHRYRNEFAMFEPSWEMFDMYILPLIENPLIQDSEGIAKLCIDFVPRPANALRYASDQGDRANADWFYHKMNAANTFISQIFYLISSEMPENTPYDIYYLPPSKCVLHIPVVRRFSARDVDKFLLNKDYCYVHMYKLPNGIYMMCIARYAMDSDRAVKPTYFELPQNIDTLDSYLQVNSTRRIAYFSSDDTQPLLTLLESFNIKED